ncbi:cytochrome P450 [Pseudahrensia aquimaris]|uniref:Cytochrome P450 n=1 Tax=Pseudahrensia aquimaris TaxID=744461 RepID=A0ABW3FCU6_9HYPH
MSNLEFDPLSPAFAANPYAFYAKLREAEGLVWFEQLGMYIAARHADVVAITTNPACVRSLTGFASEEELRTAQRAANWHDMPYHERVVQFSLLDSDGPVHRRLRKLVFGSFTAMAVEGLDAVVRPFVNELLDGLEHRESFDFTNDFAVHVPGFLIGYLLGAPREDAEQLRVWSEQVVKFFDVDRSDALKIKAEKATREFYHYLEDLMREREKAPRYDLISKMLEDKKAGHYSQDEFISTCMLILMAGHGSTIDVLGSGMNTLIDHPDAWTELKAAPEKLPSAIQEIFRTEPPLPFFHRHATQDIEVAGRVFENGTTFGLLYGGANRDAAAFTQPDVFDIRRTPNRHLAFGQGAHLCLGNNLARMNMRVVFECLLQRFSGFELVGGVEWKRGLSVRGPVALQVRPKT